MASNKKIIEKSRKLVIVGDGMAGKTSLLHAYVHNTFDTNHTPTIFDTLATEIQVNNKKVMLALFDTAGQEDFDRLRPLSYNNSNIVLISFSVSHPSSAQNVIQKWNPEVRHFCGPCPVILVACKIDLRTDTQTIEKLKRESQKPVTTEDGRRIATQIKANEYLECSAKTREGVQDVFEHAARLALEKSMNSNQRPKCTLI